VLHFDLNQLGDLRLEEFSWARIPYRRPRIAGKNARLDTHGWGGEFPCARIRSGGAEGFGWCALARGEAERLTGFPVKALFREDGMLRKEYRGLEFPILDWLGHLFHKPVYLLAASEAGSAKENFSVPVYDTTIYFDELHISDNKQAVEFMVAEAAEGLERGHRHFKIKIGRCGMWMGLKEGLERDIAVVNNIRKLAGPDAKIMVDANNGYNLNITREFLSATGGAKLFWLEEAFHEDDMLYGKLKGWMKEKGISTLIADGEGHACEAIVDWAKKGIIDVLQYDLRSYGFFNWMELCREIEPFGILAAPHNYGGFYGNYAQAHFAASAKTFALAEFDVADAEGIDASGYAIREGSLNVPPLDGFGLRLDDKQFDGLSKQNGYSIKERRHG
jgi:L-alanine-DL-glutamate epimerase-like enolase superfamily enzyme